MPGDRNEQASPHRREKARKDGDILHSRELSSAAATLAGVLSLGFLGQKLLRLLPLLFLICAQSRPCKCMGTFHDSANPSRGPSSRDERVASRLHRRLDPSLLPLL